MKVDASVLVDLAGRMRQMTAGFRNELAVVWPLSDSGVGYPVIASVGDERHVRVLPERVFGHALRCGARGVVLAHNHACQTGPSAADLAVTRRLVAAGHVVDVPLIAHLVTEPCRTYELVSGTTFTAESAALLPR